jgi:hypothetical protein
MVEDLQALLACGAPERPAPLPTMEPGLDVGADLAALVPNPEALGDPAPAVRRNGMRWRLPLMSSALLAAVAVSYVALRPSRAASEIPTETIPATAVPATLPESQVRPSEAPARREGPAPAAPAATIVVARKREPTRREVPELVAAIPVVVEPARLRIDFEHSLTSGTLQISVDGQVVLQQELESRGSTGIPGLKLRKGRFDQEVAVKPGMHTVRVQVHWDDNQREGVLSSDFPSGGARLLEVNLGRIRKNLSLEWK